MNFLGRVCLIIGVIFLLATKSFATNEDLGWAAQWLLPSGQFGTDEAEWTSTSGYIYGYGNVITTKLRFDDVAINTFKHQIAGLYHFGLEVDIVECSDSGPQLNTENIQHSFPSLAKPAMDTDFGDSITNSGACESNGGHPYVVGALMLRSPQELESNMDYYVSLNLDGPIPTGGVNLHLTLKLTQYVPVIKLASTYSKYASIIEGITNYYGSADFLDVFNYFLVESDSYNSFIARPSGYGGIRWSNKTESFPSVIGEHDMCIGLFERKNEERSFLSFIPSFVSTAYADSCASTISATKQPMYMGNLNIPIDYDGASPGEPQESVSLPNLHIEEFNIHDAQDYELPDDGTGIMNVGQKYEIHVWPESLQENCMNGIEDGKDTVETDTFLKIGDDGDWEFLYRNYTQCVNMDEDDSKKEIFDFVVPEEAYGKTIYFKSKVDSTGEVYETNEGDNWSDTEAYLVPERCTICPDFAITNVSLTGGRTQLNIGDHFGLRMVVSNLSPTPSPRPIRSAYYLLPPGATSWQYGTDDGTEAYQLCSGCSMEEWNKTDPFVANVAGVWQGMVCADYLGVQSEDDETNNCTEFSFEVRLIPVRPDFIISSLGFREGLRFKSGTRVHPWAYVKNIGNASPSVATKIAYYIDGGYRDNDSIEIGEALPGVDHFEEVLNNDIKLGDKGNRTLKVCADYQGSQIELNESNNCLSVPFVVY